MAKKITRGQQLAMLNFLECHPNMVTGKFVGPNGRQKNLDHWKELADILNSDGQGPSKTTEKWQKTWQDWRSFVKKLAGKNRTYSSGTGGGKPAKPLTELEEKVLELISEVSVAGLEDVEEVGLRVAPPEVSPQASSYGESRNLTATPGNLKRRVENGDSGPARTPKKAKIPASEFRDATLMRAIKAMEQANAHLGSIAESLKLIASHLEKTTVSFVRDDDKEIFV